MLQCTHAVGRVAFSCGLIPTFKTLTIVLHSLFALLFAKNKQIHTADR